MTTDLRKDKVILSIYCTIKTTQISSRILRLPNVQSSKEMKVRTLIVSYMRHEVLLVYINGDREARTLIGHLNEDRAA